MVNGLQATDTCVSRPMKNKLNSIHWLSWWRSHVCQADGSVWQLVYRAFLPELTSTADDGEVRGQTQGRPM